MLRSVPKRQYCALSEKASWKSEKNAQSNCTLASLLLTNQFQTLKNWLYMLKTLRIGELVECRTVGWFRLEGTTWAIQITSHSLQLIDMHPGDITQSIPKTTLYLWMVGLSITLTLVEWKEHLRGEPFVTNLYELCSAFTSIYAFAFIFRNWCQDYRKSLNKTTFPSLLTGYPKVPLVLKNTRQLFTLF